MLWELMLPGGALRVTSAEGAGLSKLWEHEEEDLSWGFGVGVASSRRFQVMVWCTTPEMGWGWGAGQALRLLMGIPKLGAQARKGGAPTRLASGPWGQSDLAGASVAGVKALQSERCQHCLGRVAEVGRRELRELRTELSSPT